MYVGKFLWIEQYSSEEILRVEDVQQEILNSSLIFLRRMVLLHECLEAPVYQPKISDELSYLLGILRVNSFDSLLSASSADHEEITKYIHQLLLAYESQKQVYKIESIATKKLGLIELPNQYQEIIHHYIDSKCLECGSILNEPVLCLLCGTLTQKGKGCCGDTSLGECFKHSIICK